MFSRLALPAIAFLLVPGITLADPLVAIPAYYTATQIPLPSKIGVAQSITVGPGGSVAGNFYTDTTHATPFVYSNGTTTILSRPQGPNYFAATGVDRSGIVSGGSGVFTSPGAEAGYWDRGGWHAIPGLGGPWGSSATSINNGRIVGVASTPTPYHRPYDSTQLYASHAFVFENGVTRDLGTLGGPNSVARAVSENGLIVGDADIATPVGGAFASHAFLYANGTMHDLGVSGYQSFATGVNDSGQVVGLSQTGRGDAGFLYQNGLVQDLTPFLGPNAVPSSISEDGTVAGGYGRNGAFVYRNGQVWYLNALLPRIGHFTRAEISPDGYVVAERVDGTAYLLTPTDAPPPPPAEAPEPASLSLAGLGAALAGLGAWRAKRRQRCSG